MAKFCMKQTYVACKSVLMKMYINVNFSIGSNYGIRLESYQKGSRSNGCNKFCNKMIINK